MTKITPEQSGKKILQIFKSFNVRTNEILMQGSISIHGFKMGLNADDLNAGMSWLIDNEYVYQKPAGSAGAYFLSELGFEKM